MKTIKNKIKNLFKEEYVWYVSYGSNLSRDRFMTYINGGRVPHTNIYEVGCRNRNSPLKEKSIIINHRLYFGNSSKRWQYKGVAFIESNPSKCKTYAKAYLITKQQFIDIVNQENGMSLKRGDILSAIKKSKDRGCGIVDNGKYGKILFLGNNEKYPMFTFTGLYKYQEKTPSSSYMNMISNGLKDSHGLTKSQVIDYFNETNGVRYGKNVLNYLID